MRLRRLDLIRYGKFTDHSIDFGEAAPERCDLHVIYGPNEAGKSTTLAAFLDLLFGIETRSDYGFLHPYATMRIGAALELDGVVRDFARIKRPHNSLLDQGGQPVAGAAILAELGGMDRDAYRNMFSLDDKKLEEGGDSILASKGDLGQLLFSASAGLADLSQGLVDIEAEAQGFYKSKARGGALVDFKKRLADLKAEREKIDTLASDHARLVQDRDGAAALYGEAIAERGRVQIRIEESQRQVDALPRLDRLRSLRERLTPYADLPEPPREWAGRLPGLRKAAVELDVGLAAVEREIEQRCATRDAITVDEAALDHAGTLEGLADLRARFITAEKDLPDRRLRLREAEGTIDGLLHRLERDGEAEPSRLMLGASILGRVRGLIEARSGIDTALTSASSELAAARDRQEDALAALHAAGDVNARPIDDAAMLALAATIEAVRLEDFTARRRLAERSRAAAGGTLEDRRRGLRPWRGDAEALFDLVVPDADMRARWTKGIADAQKKIERHGAEAEGLATERRRYEAERDAIAAFKGVVTDQDASDLRALRERLWADHRRTLDAVTADAFETALRRDDAVTAGRFGHMADLAKLHQASQAIAVATAQSERAGELRDRAVEALQAIEDHIAQAVRTTSEMLHGMALPQFESWLVRRDAALQSRDLVRAAERDLRAADADEAAARGRLAGALEAAGVPFAPEDGFDRLLWIARGASDGARALKASRATTEERERDVAARERKVETAEAEAVRWGEDWGRACAACWLGEGGIVPSLATVREILPILVDLGSAVEKKAGLADRVVKMDEDQKTFGEAVLALAEAMGIAGASGSALDLVRSIDRRVASAQANASRRDAETHKIAEVRERRLALADSLEVHRREVDGMMKHFGVETLDDVALNLAEVEKRADLTRQAEETKRDILAALRLPTLKEAEQALAGADRAALDAECAASRSRFDDLDQRCHELFSTHSKAIDRVEAIGGDAQVAGIEERRRTILLEIQDGARRYLRLRAGAMATEWALRAYRERHRSAMMNGVAQAFETISRGAYTGLATQPENDKEVLVALAAGGGSKKAYELSKGTRFQLYLALRVAGYHEFVRARRPVPFIADDIMETFDDFRAEEAFRLFGAMAGVGQVIYLTHHRHLCAIATSVCPGATIHEIAS